MDAAVIVALMMALWVFTMVLGVAVRITGSIIKGALAGVAFAVAFLAMVGGML